MLIAGWLPPALPTPPPPEGFHVLLIHFPIALLLVAPLFVLLGALVAARWQGFAVTAALLMILGTAGTWVAVSTGEDARDAVEDASDQALEVMDQHEELGELTRNVYTGVTAAYVLFVFLTLVWSPISKAAIRIPLGLIFLVLSGGAALYLASTAHLGGRLVHEFGIRAKLAETAPPDKSGEATESEQATEAAADTAKGEPEAGESQAEGQEAGQAKGQAKGQPEGQDKPEGQVEGQGGQVEKRAEGQPEEHAAEGSGTPAGDQVPQGDAKESAEQAAPSGDH